MSTKPEDATTLQRAQQRNWSWCRIANAAGQLRAVADDTNNVLLPVEKDELRSALVLLEVFLKQHDNSTNWSLKKAMEAKAREAREQAEEF